MRCTCGTLGVFTVLGVLSLAGMSCTSQRLGYDHRQMRTELLTAYEEQLMDNLVRAREGLPLLQIKYGVIDGTSKTNLKATGSIDENSTDVIQFGKDDSITDDDGSGGTAEVALESTMAIKGTPVLDDPDLYKAYRAFAKSYLVRSDGLPADNVEVLLLSSESIRRGPRRETHFYWVPRYVHVASAGAELVERIPCEEGGVCTDDSGCGGSDRVDVKPRLEALIDRVVLDQKKESGDGFEDSAEIAVTSIDEKKADDLQEGVLGFTVSFQPSLPLVHGQIGLSSQSKRSIVVPGAGLEDGAQVVGEKATVSGLLVGSATEGKRVNTGDFYVMRRDALKLLDPPNPTASDAQLRKLIEAKMLHRVVKLSYERTQSEGVDLNKTVGALVQFLDKSAESSE